MTSGYSRMSIAAHWLAFLAIVALFVTHEGERGSAMQAFHIGGGAILGIFILWRALRRPLRGFTAKPDQNAFLNLVSMLVIWGLILDMVVVIVSGYMAPWSGGRAIDIYGLVSLPSPIAGSPQLHEAFEEIHEIAGQAIIPLVALHVLGALKHVVMDRDGIMMRMLRPVAGGR